MEMHELDKTLLADLDRLARHEEHAVVLGMLEKCHQGRLTVPTLVRAVVAVTGWPPSTVVAITKELSERGLLNLSPVVIAQLPGREERG